MTKAHYSRLGRMTYGTDKGTAKLTEADVLEIRASTEPHTHIARRKRVSKRQVQRIRNREQWAWL